MATPIGAVESLHSIGTVKIGTVEFHNVANHRVNRNASMVMSRSSGFVFPSYAGIQEENPEYTWSTLELKKLLDLTTDCGVEILTNPYQAFYSKKKKHGKREAGSNHIETKSRQGILYTGQISVEGNQPASAEVVMRPTWDGTNDIVEVTGSVALPAAITLLDEWTTGPISLNGTEVSGIQSTTINFGIEVEGKQGGGLGLPTFNSVKLIDPKISFRTTEASILTTIGEGLVLSGAGLKTFLRHKKKHGRRTPDTGVGNEKHILFTATSGIARIADHGGSSEDDAEYNVEVDLTEPSVGTNPIVINTATTIVI